MNVDKKFALVNVFTVELIVINFKIVSGRSVNHNVADFLGISASYRGPDSEQKQQWKNRARSMHTRSRLSSRVKQDRAHPEHEYGASGAGSVPDSADTLDGRHEAFQFQTRYVVSFRFEEAIFFYISRAIHCM